MSMEASSNDEKTNKEITMEKQRGTENGDLNDSEELFSNETNKGKENWTLAINAINLDEKRNHAKEAKKNFADAYLMATRKYYSVSDDDTESKKKWLSREIAMLKNMAFAQYLSGECIDALFTAEKVSDMAKEYMLDGNTVTREMEALAKKIHSELPSLYPDES